MNIKDAIRLRPRLKSLSEIETKLEQYKSELQEYKRAGKNISLPMQRLGSYLASITDPDIIESFENSPYLRINRPFFVAMQAEYYQETEQTEAALLLGKGKPEGLRDIEEHAREFSREAYERVWEIFKGVNFEDCSRFFMVGCGPLPSTLFSVYDHTRVPKIIGIDANRQAVNHALTLLSAARKERIMIQEADGRSYDYRDEDVIYVANLVLPKKQILDRISETAKVGVQVILRDPHGMGVLLSERGMETLSERFSVVAEGEPNSRFLSKHIFLRTRRI